MRKELIARKRKLKLNILQQVAYDCAMELKTKREGLTNDQIAEKLISTVNQCDKV